MKLLPVTPVILFIFCIGIPAHAADLFVDKTLESAVRQQVFAKRNSKDPLLAEDVKHVSTVKARGKKIRSLKGLEACKALASLELPDNEIEDLSPLADLERLQLLCVHLCYVLLLARAGQVTAGPDDRFLYQQYSCCAED